MSTPVCPRCREEVSLPNGASPRATVECPLCLERYPLGEAMRTMAPLLTVIDDPDAGLTAVADPIAGYRLAEEASVPESAPAFDFRESAAPTVTRPSVTPVTRPRRPPKNPVVEVVKIIGGGIVGVFLAVLIVWWIIRPGKDPFGAGPTVGRVPVLKHLVPREYRGESIAETDDDKPTADRPKAGDKRASGKRNPTKRPRTPSRTIGGNPRGADDRKEVEPERAVAPPEPPMPEEESAAQPGEAPSDPSTPAPTADPESSAEFLGVREAPEFSADEFDNALLDVDQARAEWSTTDAPEANAAAERKMYEQLAQLAHITTFLSPQDFKNRNREARLRRSLTETAGTPEQRRAVARLAAEWLERPEVRKGSGIAIVGVVKSISPEGKLFTTQLAQPDTQTLPLIVVYSYRDPHQRIQPGDEVLVLGSIVAAPATRLAGYAGQAEEVVWGGYPIPLSGN